jgi:hypothetical protein
LTSSHKQHLSIFGETPEEGKKDFSIKCLPRGCGLSPFPSSLFRPDQILSTMDGKFKRKDGETPDWKKVDKN